MDGWWYAYTTADGDFGDYFVPELKTYEEGDLLILDLTAVDTTNSFEFGEIVNDDTFSSG